MPAATTQNSPNPAKMTVFATPTGENAIFAGATVIIATSTGPVERAMAAVEGSTGTVEGSTGPVEGSTGAVESAMAPVEGSTGVVESATGPVEDATGIVESAIEMVNLTLDIGQTARSDRDASTSSA